MASHDAPAKDTLAMLEARLQRLDFLLNGDNYQLPHPPTQDTGSAALRLRILERQLHSLSSTSPAVAAVLSLQEKHPHILHPTSNQDSPPPAFLAALVLSHESLYTTTSARLSQLQDLSIPDPTTAAKLIDLQPRIEQARAKQAAQAREFAELRARSGRAVERWYEGGVLGMDGLWADWEERLRDAEILVRRKEAARKREEGAV